jgi:HK97 family phage prohead protease
MTTDATTTEDIATMKRGQLNNVREVRHYGISDIEVREEGDDTGAVTFTGYASVFNHDYEVYDSFGKFTERLAPGAFTRTLTEDPDVMLLINHQGLPLARTKSGTLQLAQDKVGLRVSAQLDANDPDVQAVLPKMRRGDVDEMSFAFRVNEQEWSEDYSDRTITEVNLARGDVSIVSYGANPATVAALRAALADEDVRAQLLGELGEDRILTTDIVDEPTDGEPVEAPVEDVEDDTADDEERGWKGFVPTMTYHLSQLADRRQSV